MQWYPWKFKGSQSCVLDSELTFQLLKMCGVGEAIERWSMGSWCLVGVSAELLCI